MTDDTSEPQVEKSTEDDDPWQDDRLNRRKRAEAFTNLVTSDTKSKVISIEAGFGEGKTFFRKAWAKHLSQMGETVIEFDAWKSDHSDDPLMAFVGALMAEMPSDLSDEVLEKVRAGAWTLGGILAKGLASWALREAAEDLTDWVSSLSEDEELAKTLTTLTGDAAGEVSSVTKKMLVAQIVREHARQKQLPDQLKALRDALEDEKENPEGRIVVIIDELDRCRPDYAISLLEAIKHLFDQPGYIFILMLNPEQFERTAASLFGEIKGGEPYFAKFIDLRLKLSAGNDDRQPLIEDLCRGLHYTAWNGEACFGLERLIEVAGKVCGPPLTIRQVKRALLNVDLAMLCDGERPLDGPLLTYLALNPLQQEARKRSGRTGFIASSESDLEKLFPYLGSAESVQKLTKFLQVDPRFRGNLPSEFWGDFKRIRVLKGSEYFSEGRPSEEDIPLLEELEKMRSKHLQIHKEALEGAIRLRADEPE